MKICLAGAFLLPLGKNRKEERPGRGRGPGTATVLVGSLAFRTRNMKSGISAHLSSKRLTTFVVGLGLLFFSGLTYVTFRGDDLLMFRWFDDLGISEMVYSFRTHTAPLAPLDTLVYNYPAAFWLLSYLLIIDSLWHSPKNATDGFTYRLFLSVLPASALLSEALQYGGFFPGTFDPQDFIAYLAAVGVFIIIKAV